MASLIPQIVKDHTPEVVKDHVGALASPFGAAPAKEGVTIGEANASTADQVISSVKEFFGSLENLPTVAALGLAVAQQYAGVSGCNVSQLVRPAINVALSVAPIATLSQKLKQSAIDIEEGKAVLNLERLPAKTRKLAGAATTFISTTFTKFVGATAVGFVGHSIGKVAMYGSSALGFDGEFGCRKTVEAILKNGVPNAFGEAVKNAGWEEALPMWLARAGAMGYAGFSYLNAQKFEKDSPDAAFYMKLSAVIVAGFIVAEASGLDAAENLASHVWAAFDSPSELFIVANAASTVALDKFGPKRPATKADEKKDAAAAGTGTKADKKKDGDATATGAAKGATTGTTNTRGKKATDDDAKTE